MPTAWHLHTVDIINDFKSRPLMDLVPIVSDREGSGWRRSPYCLPQWDKKGGFCRWTDGQGHLLQRRHQTDHSRPESGETFYLNSYGRAAVFTPCRRKWTVRPLQTNNRLVRFCAQIYYYADAQTTHITYPDGMEVLHFPNNQTGETRRMFSTR